MIKRLRFIKNQELNQALVLIKFKIIKIVKNFLLAGDKFMSKLHSRQPGFSYSDQGPFTKHRERVLKFRETGDLNLIYKNKSGKACFAHDVAYSDKRNLPKRTISDKIFRNRAYEIARNPK